MLAPLVGLALVAQSGPTIGQTYVLAQKGNPVVLLFRTQEAWQAAQAASEKDLPAFFALTESDKAFRVRGLETRAKLLQVVPGKVAAACVLIGDGPERGHEGWVRVEHLKDRKGLDDLLREMAHKPGENYVICQRGGQPSILATTDEASFRATLVAAEKDDDRALTALAEAGKMIEVENVAEDRAQATTFRRLLPGRPDLAEVLILTGKHRGEVVVIADSALATPIEAATIMGELEAARKAGEAMRAKLDASDPATFTKVIKQARIAANEKHAGVRRSAFEREKKQRQAALAKKLGVPTDLLVKFMAEKGYDK